MSEVKTPILTDTWVKATWDEYLKAVDVLDSEKAKGYYNNGCYKLEMTPISFDHSFDHAIIILAASNYAIFSKIPFISLDTCSYRKTGYREAQPDISFYVGDNAEIIPHGTLELR